MSQMAAIASSWRWKAPPSDFQVRVNTLMAQGVLFGSAVLQARRERGYATEKPYRDRWRIEEIEATMERKRRWRKRRYASRKASILARRRSGSG